MPDSMRQNYALIKQSNPAARGRQALSADRRDDAVCPSVGDDMLQRANVLTLVVCLAIGLFVLGCGDRGPDHTGSLARTGNAAPPAIDASLQAELETWLAQHGRPPADYILGLFADHDVVLLGEQHRIRHDPELVQGLVPRLGEAGVGTVALEFARREEQSLIDSVVTAREWQEELAREVFFRGFMPWGFQEYVDVLKAAWRVDLERPPGTPALRVLGVNNSLDYTHFKTEADWDDREVRKRVWRGQTEAD